MKTVKMVAWILLIVGGLNWGLVGIFDFNLVAALLGTGMVANVVYSLVGISAIVSIFGCKKGCDSNSCETKTEESMSDSQM